MQLFLERIDLITDRFMLEFGSLDTGELNWKPDENTWSIAQNIDHVILLNESYFKKIEEAGSDTAKRPFLARFDIIPDLMAKALTAYSKPDRKKKTGTFDIWKPGSQRFEPSILETFAEHQERFKEVIRQSRPLMESGKVVRSPASGVHFFKPASIFDIMVSHEERHLNQAKRVKTSEKFGQRGMRQ